jgi:O-antigen ligase
MIIVVLLGASSLLIAGATNRRWLVPSSLLVIVLLAVAVANFDAIIDVVSDKLLISDEYRGGATGLVGRADMWAATYNLFLDNPLIGVGSGQHIIILGASMYAHNMYLIVLAENGIVGFIFFVFSTSIAIVGFAKLRGDSGAQCVKGYAFSLLVAYFLYGIVEGRGINIGNVLSFGFFLILGMGAHLSLRRRSPLELPSRMPSVSQPA